MAESFFFLNIYKNANISPELDGCVISKMTHANKILDADSNILKIRIHYEKNHQSESEIIHTRGFMI